MHYRSKDFSPRILGGMAKGRKLICPKGLKLRPALSRIKKSIFDIIQFELAEATVLDLFAGTGSLGLEAFSRGAKEVHFVEFNYEVVKNIEQNIKHCKFEEKCNVIYANAFEIFSDINIKDKKFNIIFAAPPYPVLDDPEKNKAFINIFVQLRKKGFIFDNGQVIIETRRKQLDLNIFAQEFLDVQCRQYGQTDIIILKA